MAYSTHMLCPNLARLLIVLALLTSAAQAQPYKYIRVGNPASLPGNPHPGYALMGGGTDLDEAFQWLCVRAGGGDLLVLRAAGTDAYNPYIQPLCHANSVATLIVPSRAAAMDPFAAKTIRAASGLFIAGGDQANYINFWQSTPVQEALNEAIRRGIPIGGTSAGLAILGEYAYTAQGDKPDDPNLDAANAFAHPYGPRITLHRGFLSIPALKAILTDSHFARRDRMGRLLVFLARLNEPDARPLPAEGEHHVPDIRGIGIEQGAAVLLEPDGNAKVIGAGAAYFVSPIEDAVFASTTPAADAPLVSLSAKVLKVPSGKSFNLPTWQGEAIPYTLTLKGGRLESTQPGGRVY